MRRTYVQAAHLGVLLERATEEPLVNLRQPEPRTRWLNHPLTAIHLRVLQIVKFAVGLRRNGTS